MWRCPKMGKRCKLAAAANGLERFVLRIPTTAYRLCITSYNRLVMLVKSLTLATPLMVRCAFTAAVISYGGLRFRQITPVFRLAAVQLRLKCHKVMPHGKVL